ncbi:MAG TPA: type II toxin-antitoxin system VapB family antitoxin [Pyrinomonadaceae bacterium]|nr:type II toxin-antitoxin system VapB family antitoxin [Pyrinomonadaceae bacterium]
MRIRTNLIIEETLLAKIDRLAGDKNKRAATIEKALREFIEREEIKEANNPKTDVVSEKAGSETKQRARV